MLEKMQKFAQAKGGRCLSEIYFNTRTKLLWECDRGHQWEAVPYSITSLGTWCPVCYRQREPHTKYTIGDMKALAAVKGGDCLSDKYEGSRKLLWKCAHGHEWQAPRTSIQLGYWCPGCAGNARKSIDDMVELAALRGGQCLSKTYGGNNARKLLWQCGAGHVFEARPNNVHTGYWCPFCAGNKKHSLGFMQDLAKARGGECLSTVYRGLKAKLLWRCKHGHTWEGQPASLLHVGTWCPECSSGVGERIARVIFESLFAQGFPRSSPAWLLSKRGYRMHLDGYCEELNLAFEHQGVQHYEEVPHFNRRGKGLRVRQEFDALKARLCKKHQVSLIHVPEIPTRLSVQSAVQYIIAECQRHGISVPEHLDLESIDLRAAYETCEAINALNELKEIARSRGGACLSDAYLNNAHRLLWECALGHRWMAVPSSVKRGSWCMACAGTQKRTIEDMRTLAAGMGGKCLSETYVNDSTKLLWACGESHQWATKPTHIRQGHWCPVCARKKRDPAQSRGE